MCAPGRIASMPAASAAAVTSIRRCAVGRHLADGDRARGVAEVALVAHAEIEPDDVTVAQHAAPRRDAVHDLVVDRDADRRRERAAAHDVALERRLRAVLVRQLLGERVELARWRRPGRTRAATSARISRHDPARAPHALDLVGRLEHDHARLALMRPKTSSRVPGPCDRPQQSRGAVEVLERAPPRARAGRGARRCDRAGRPRAGRARRRSRSQRPRCAGGFSSRVEHRPAAAAHEAPRQAAHQLLAAAPRPRRPRRAPGPRASSSRCSASRLRHGAREAVEDEAARAVRRRRGAPRPAPITTSSGTSWPASM